MTLTALAFRKGAKNVHPTVLCVCDCGNTRIVRATKFRLGKVALCGPCAKREAAVRGGLKRRMFTDADIKVRQNFSSYKGNAKKKNISFALSVEQFEFITSLNCAYCGGSGSIGIDRVDNLQGYTIINCAPCCTDCNFAKRKLSKDEFLALVERIHVHQSR